MTLGWDSTKQKQIGMAFHEASKKKGINVVRKLGMHLFYDCC